MGKGDRKTSKGKIAIRSYGNKRPHSSRKTTVAKKSTAPIKAAPAKKAASAPAKKKTGASASN